MKRFFTFLLCATIAGMAVAQLNEACFMIPDVVHPAQTPRIYTQHNDITTDSTVIRLPSTPIYSLAVSGSVSFSSAKSFLRIILVDCDGKEYLVYEVNDLLTDTRQFSFTDIGRETIWDKAVVPSHLTLRMDNATVSLTSINPGSKILSQSMPGMKKARIKAQNDTIVNKLNRLLIERDIPWRAGVTDLVTQPYEFRRAVLGDNSPFHNLEYCIGGYYVDPAFSPEESPATTDGFVPAFDWRNRHGRNWITCPKKQFDQACWAFAAIATGESYINLYYNKLLNIDLSEQQLDSITPNSTFARGGYINEAAQYMTTHDLVTETCYPYEYAVQLDTSASGDFYVTPIVINTQKCDDPDTLFRFEKFQTFKYGNIEQQVKKTLLKSPLAMDISSMFHVMSCIGYKTVEAGDTLYLDGHWYTYSIDTIKAGSPYIGQTAWLFKNSCEWHTDSTDIWHHYYDYIGVRYMIVNKNRILNRSSYFTNKVFSNILSDNDIVCEDRDGDGYYFWGIGEKPTHCPAWVPNEPDGDDSNSNYGPMNNYGYLREIGPKFGEDVDITTNTTWNVPQWVETNIVIHPGATLTVKSHLSIHKDAKIIVERGQLIIDGGVIHNGYICNKGSVIFRNNGVVEMRSDDQFEHCTNCMTSCPPNSFPINLHIESGGFKQYKPNN